MTDVGQVEQRTDLVKASAIEIGTTLGGVKVASIADLAKISDTLSRGEIAVPIHCRGKPGVCFALAMQALEWGLPIMSVINKSYVPRNGDRIGYESQLIHAVIEKNAPIKGRLRFEILGEGDERRCKVWATFNGETTPHEYTSETLAKMHPGHIEKDGKRFVRGSPLWDTRPEVQMFYDASRQWARLFCPDVLLGAYTPDELDNAEPIDVTPISTKVGELAQRLKESKAQAVDRGFDAEHVEREARNSIIEGSANPGAAEQEVTDEGVQGSGDEPRGEGRRDQSGDRPDSGSHQGGSDHAGGSDQEDGEQSAGSPAARETRQGEIFPPDRKPSKSKARKR
jgi:hypothetical protein